MLDVDAVVRHIKIPSSLYWPALEYCDEDRADPDRNDHDAGHVHEFSEEMIGKDSEVGCDDGALDHCKAGGVEDLADIEKLAWR